MMECLFLWRRVSRNTTLEATVEELWNRLDEGGMDLKIYKYDEMEGHGRLSKPIIITAIQEGRIEEEKISF